MIKITKLDLPEILVLEYDIDKDNRGAAYKNFSKKELQSIGINVEFVEESVYCPVKKGTLYGVHFHNNPKPQTKLLYCTKGRGLDFAVDLRHKSATYKRWVCVELSPENRKQIFIPAGFGHAFLSLEDNTNVVMRIDEYFDPKYRRGIAYNDPELNIKFPVKNPILSDADCISPLLKDSDCNL